MLVEIRKRLDGKFIAKAINSSSLGIRNSHALEDGIIDVYIPTCMSMEVRDNHHIYASLTLHLFFF